MKNILFKTYYYIGVFAFLSMGSSCKKFLDEKPNKGTVIINSMGDLQALLDAPLVTSSFIPVSTAGADEYYLTKSQFEAMPKNWRDGYVWDSRAQVDSWTSTYKIVFHCNLVLQNLERISGSAAEKSYIQGQALFHRAFAFYQLAQLYCAPYSEQSKDQMGIPLRLKADIEARYERATIRETYAQITEDLKLAADLLSKDAISLNRPNKTSAYGLLARTYLSMREYTQAETYANLYLTNSPDLLDFNTLDPARNPGIPPFNREITYFSYMDGPLPGSYIPADTVLYRSYSDKDLRKQVYFFDPGDGNYTFKGSYVGFVGYMTFCGIANDEIYLIRAECRARNGRPNEAMADINTLLLNRFKTGEYEPIGNVSAEEALAIVLAERRKELVYRGTRWTDLRRLNLEGSNFSLKRVVNGTEYALPPNHNRWTWLIPEEVLNLAGLPQNPR